MRGVAAHFRATKPTLASRNAKGGVDTKPKQQQQPTPPVTTANVEPEKPPQPQPAPTKNSRNRLKTPPPEEIEQIIADIDQTRAATPPPPVPDPTSPFLLGTPPRRRAKPASPSAKLASTSPTKRKARNSDGQTSIIASPTKAARVHDISSFATTEVEDAAEHEEEDGLVLTPGRSMGTRIALGSPKTLVSSPLATKSPTASLPRSLARRLMEDEDDSYLTPRAVRERPKGNLPSLAPSASAVLFKSGHESKPSPSAAASSSSSAVASLQDPFTSTSTATISKAPPAEPEPELPDLKHQVSTSLPLPSHYSSIMTLHVALEHALLVHLATSGASTASLESSDENGNDGTDKVVRLPNLITYTALRPLVERSGGRRLGPTELRRLASVWTDFQSSSSDVEEVKGLGFIVSKTRALDPRTGRRVWDWGIGIELEIQRAERPKTPPLHVGFGGVATTPKSSNGRFTTPPPSPSPLLHSSPRFGSPSKRRREQSGEMPSSPQARKARQDMSLVAMWNNGLEVRKAEVGRRLRERCARFHQLWLDEKGISVHERVKAEPATPSRSAVKEERETIMGEGGLLTPSATRSGGPRVGGRTIVFDQAELDRAESESEAEDDTADGKSRFMNELDGNLKRRAAATTEAAVKQEAQEGWAVPSQGDLLVAWHPDFDMDNPKTVRPVPGTELPELREAAPKMALLSGGRSLVGLGIDSEPRTPSRRAVAEPLSTPSTPGMSLKDRIRAKEEAKRTTLLRKSASSSSLGTPTKSAMMAHFSRRATLSRLPELASILFMLFPTNPRPPTLSMADVLTKLSKSTKTTMSKAECRDALDLLNEIVPGFLEVVNAGGEWVKLGRREGGYWALQEVRARIGEALQHRD